MQNENAWRQGCQKLNPNYEEIIYDNQEMKQFVHQYYPEFANTYDNDHHFFHAVMHADVWRYLVLHHYGGVYFDMDIKCRHPIDQWGETLGLLLKKRNRNKQQQTKATGAENKSSHYWHDWHWHDNTPVVPSDSDSDSDGERNDYTHNNDNNQNTDDPWVRI